MGGSTARHRSKSITKLLGLKIKRVTFEQNTQVRCKAVNSGNNRERPPTVLGESNTHSVRNGLSEG